MRDACVVQKTIQKDIRKRKAACYALQTTIEDSQVRLIVALFTWLWVSNITQKHTPLFYLPKPLRPSSPPPLPVAVGWGRVDGAGSAFLFARLAGLSALRAKIRGPGPCGPLTLIRHYLPRKSCIKTKGLCHVYAVKNRWPTTSSCWS